jgi:hypothetical protein
MFGIPEISGFLDLAKPFDSMNCVGSRNAFCITGLLFSPAKWTLKIESDSHGGKLTIRLIGRFQSEHIAELKKQIRESLSIVVLDLEEVTLVDVHVVRFVAECELRGATIVNCSQYIREWMIRERQEGAK